MIEFVFDFKFVCNFVCNINFLKEAVVVFMSTFCIFHASMNI